MTMAIGMTSHLPHSIDDTVGLLARGDYVADRALATVVFLALQHGQAAVSRRRGRRRQDGNRQGAGRALGRDLIRLQCYEGLDVNTAVYEWNYPAQMIDIRLAEATGVKDRERLGQRHLLGALPDQAAAAAGAGGQPGPRRRCC